MTHKSWWITTMSLLLIFAALVVAVNFYVDNHAVRLSLFTSEKEIQQTIFPDGINQHIFNSEYIFRNPEKFDSFLFGSSRVAVIDVAKITTGRFYNMSYSQGLPAEHLAILKAFLQKGIRIRSVVIGLDEFCFSISPSLHQKQLLRIMHPDITGESRAVIFGMYFFRKPNLYELTNWKNRVLYGKMENRFIMNNRGVNLGWLQQERIIEATGKPLFDFVIRKYEPIPFGNRDLDEAFEAIEELIALSRTHHFTITFFITPLYAQSYLNSAEGLFKVKALLAGMTDYYDFSGLNSVTNNNMNYYEKSHYRYRVGDMIIRRILGQTNDFGVLVNAKNAGSHIQKQKQELNQYLKTQNLR